jgi:hypothetical protein
MIQWKDLTAPAISGYAVECLKAVGQLPYSGDWTAQALWILFKHREILDPGPGCLVFWETVKDKSPGVQHKRMTHIEIAVNSRFSIGASGGGSGTTDLRAAIEDDAYIKMRPFRNRDSRKLFFVDPFKED